MDLRNETTGKCLAPACNYEKPPGRQLRLSIFAKKTHIEVPVVGRAFALAVPRSRRPGSGEIEQAVPIHVIEPRHQQFRSLLQSELLHFFGAKRRNAYFRNPDRLWCDRLNLSELVRPS